MVRRAASISAMLTLVLIACRLVSRLVSRLVCRLAWSPAVVPPSPLAGKPSTLHLESQGSDEDTMTESGPRRIGVAIELKPHAYDPAANPELFEGVLARRCIAFLIDVVIIAIPVLLAAIFIFIFGIITLGLGWALYWLLSPGTVVWAIVYYGMTFGAPASATIGMRVMDIEMRTWYGAPAYFVLGAVHAVVYWVTILFLTPLILLVALFNQRRRLLHDMLVGTIVINTGTRAQALRRTSGPQTFDETPRARDPALAQYPPILFNGALAVSVPARPRGAQGVYASRRRAGG